MKETRALALPAFHALTGCDTTASFFNKGKKLPWEVWNSYPPLTRPLTVISHPGAQLRMVMPFVHILHNFVNRLYGIETDNLSVDDVRLDFVLHKGKQFDELPLSSDALHQKIMRVTYQAGHVWGNLIEKNPKFPNITDWGWIKDGPTSAPEPCWITQPVLSGAAMKELAICKCKSGNCKHLCTCCQHNQVCTALCGCQGSCQHTVKLSSSRH